MGASRISSKRRITIPLEAFLAAGFQEGDVVQGEALAPGRLVVSRQNDLLDQFSSVLTGGPAFQQIVEQLRDEFATARSGYPTR